MDEIHPIRAYRESQGLSATDLAIKLDVKRNTVWRWENRRQSIERRLWHRVHEVTGIPIEQLAMLGKDVAA